MAKKDIPEMVKITIDTSNLQDFDENNKPLGTYRGALKTLDSDLSAFERVVKSATNYFKFFNKNLKRIDEKTGLAEQSFFIRKDELDNVLVALKSKNAELSAVRGDSGFHITVTDAEVLQSTRKILGKKAQKMATEEVYRLGGEASVNTRDKDKLDIILPVAKSYVQEMTSSEKSSLITKAIPSGRKLSRAENKLRKEEEREKTVKEEVETVKAQKLAEDKAKKDAEKLLEKAEKDEERRKKEERTQQKAELRKVFGVVKTVVATLTVIADIARRILTATLKSASENEKKSMEAHSIGVTAMQRRNLDLFDTAHGMEKGTSFRAIQSVQNSFGDITNLDEKSLSTLARVMGSEISDLVTSGMGGKNPDQLLDKILDKYFSQYLSGKNSLGKPVGREEARRELITSLQTVSPDIAKVFARMIEDFASGYYKPFSNSKEWRNTNLLNLSGLSENDLKFNTEIGKKYNEIISIVNDLKDGFFVRLASTMNSLINNIKNIRILYSGEANIEQDKRNREASLNTKTKLEEQLSIYNTNSQPKLNMLSSVDYTPTMLRKDKVKDFKYSAETLARIRTGTLTKEFLETNLDSTGMKSIKEMNTYISRGKEVLSNAVYNPDVFDEVILAIVNLNRINEIEKDVKNNKIGSGKVKDLSMSRAEQVVEAEKLIENHANKSHEYGTVKYSPTSISDYSPEFYKQMQLAYFDELLNNRSEYESAKRKMSKTDKKELKQTLESIAKEKNIEVDELSEEEQILAFAMIKAKSNFIPKVIAGTQMPFINTTAENYYNKHFIDEAKKSLNMSSSVILGQLAGLTVNTSAGNYQVVGKQGQSGEYIVYLQSVDSKGNNVGGLVPILNLSDTKANTGFLGSATVGTDGSITLNESQ